MSVKQTVCWLIGLIAILALAVFLGREEERRQYKMRCGCENCDCRCHVSRE